MSFSTRAMLVGLMLVFVPGFSASAQDAKAKRNDTDALVEGEVNKYIVVEFDSTDAIEEIAEEEPMEPSPYWFGVQCEPVGQFEMTTEVTGVITVVGGLKINAVFEGSPAEGAKFQEGDVLFKCDGKTMVEMRDLIDLTREKGESPISTRVFRDGVLKTIEITPAKRPELSEEFTLDGDQTEFAFFYPNLSNGQLVIPEGYEFTIRLTSDNGAEIKAEKGDDVWPVESGKLSKLPEDLQGVASSLITRLTPQSYSLALTEKENALPNQDQAALFWTYSNENSDLKVSNETADLSEKIEQLQEEVESIKALLIESMKASDPNSSGK